MLAARFKLIENPKHNLMGFVSFYRRFDGISEESAEEMFLGLTKKYCLKARQSEGRINVSFSGRKGEEFRREYINFINTLQKKSQLWHTLNYPIHIACSPGEN